MKAAETVLEQPLARASTRLFDYLDLIKPELTGLAVLTALCGFYLGNKGSFDLSLFLWTALGTMLVGGGAGALNQYIERDYDRMMRRTERRPLPAGRLSPNHALWFGIIISVAGTSILSLRINLLTGFLAALTLTSYLFLYTPLKRVTPLNTFVGGIPGALPPLMGWAAVRNDLSVGAWILFAILFFWQIPHFLSLAWMYRKDYSRAGFKMLTVIDVNGFQTSIQVIVCCAALIFLSVCLWFTSIVGWFFLGGAIILGGGFLYFAISFYKFTTTPCNFALAKTNYYSRQIFFASLWYLPALMLLMVLDKV